MAGSSPILHTSRDRQDAASQLAAYIAFADVNVDTYKLSTSLSREMEFEIYTPKREGQFNTLFYIPGTASQTIAVKPVRAVLSNISNILSVRVVAIFHDLSSMNKHPIPYNEVCEGINALLKAPPFSFHKIALGGDSSGGLLALLVAINAIDKQIPFSQLILFAPVVDMAAMLMLQEKKDMGFGTPRFFKHFIEVYLPEGKNPTDPDVSPFYCDDKYLKKLPQTVLVSGTQDVIHESIVEFSKKLLNPSVEILDGCNHGFVWQDTQYLNRIKGQIDRGFTAGQEVDKLSFSPLDIIPVELPRRLGNPPAFDSSRHVFREKQEADLLTIFNKRAGEQTVVAVVLGESGSGKTQFALNYYYSSWRYPNCYWLDASSEEQLKVQFIALGVKDNLFFGDVETSVKVDFVRKHLELKQNTLIIFDNVKSPRIIEEFVPKYNAHVLATSLSIDEDWSGKIFMRPLEEDEAYRFILKCLQNDSSQLVQELSKRFIISPLGLLHAVQHFIDIKMEEDDYCKEIDKLSHEKPQRGLNHIVLTLRLNYLYYNQSPKIYQLLQLISSFSLSTIPLIFFLEDYDKLVWLEKQKFITINSETGYLFCHAIIQECVRARGKIQREEYVSIVDRALIASRDNLKDPKKNKYDDDILLIYFRELSRIIEQEGLENSLNQEALIEFYIKLSEMLAYHLNSKESIPIAQKAIALSDKPAISDQIMFNALWILQAAYWEVGMMYDGLEVGKKILQFCEEREKNEIFRKKSAAVKYNLALSYTKLGQVESFFLLMGKAIQLFEQFSGEIMQELQQEQRDEKRDGELKKELEKYQQNTTKGYIMLAFSYAKEGRLEEANLCLGKSKEILLANFSGGDKEKLRKNSIYLMLWQEARGSVLCRAGYLIEGIACLRNSLHARIEAFGDNYRLVAATKAGIALYLDDHEESYKLFGSALETFYRLYSHDNSFIADCYRNIGVYLMKHKRQDLAKVYFLEALRIMRNLFLQFYDHHTEVIRVKESLMQCGFKESEIENAVDKNLQHAESRRDILRNYFMQIRRETKAIQTEQAASCFKSYQKFILFGASVFVTGALTGGAIVGKRYQP